MLKQEFTFEGSKRKPYTLNGVLWAPENREADRMVHVFHGMTEHIGRYETFAEAMTKQGIAVAGFDLRGHGKNLGNPDCASLGEGGWDCALEDMKIFSNMLYEISECEALYAWIFIRFFSLARVSDAGK